MASKSESSHPATDQLLRSQAEALWREKRKASMKPVEELSPEAIRSAMNDLQVHQIELEMQNEELRRAQLDLETSHARYAEFYDMAPVGYVTISEKGLILQANLKAAAMLGVARPDLIKRPFFSFVLKKHQDIYSPLRKQVLEVGHPQSCELQMVKNDGAHLWVHLSATAAQTQDGVPELRLVLHDVSARKQAEQALLVSEARYARALSGSSEGLWDWSISTHELYLSPRWKKLLGFKGDELPNHPDSFFTRLHPDDVARVQDAVQAHLDRSAPYDLDLRLRTKDGGYRWFRSRGEAERNDQGQAVRMAGTIYDVSQTKLAEDKLASEQDFNRALVNHTSALIVVLDEQSRITHVNPAFEKGLGYDLSMLMGRPLWDSGMMSAAEIRRAKQRYQLLLAGKEVPPVELRLRAKNGDWHLLELNPTTVHHPEGRLSRIILTFTDTTERARMQREILKISEQEQARIGHNLHDGVGQTMTGLSSLMESLESELTGSQRASASRIREALQDALLEVRRMSHGLSPASVKNRGLSGALQLLSDTLRLNHRTDCACEVDSTIKLEDEEKETHIFRIAQEASNNAIRHGHPKKITISLQRLGPEECVLKIENNGAAIAKKKDKSGEGIGVQVMDYRANLIGGTLSITSSPRSGVSVSCRFPYADDGQIKPRSNNSWDI